MEIALPSETLISRSYRRLLTEFGFTAEEWMDTVTSLSRWEDEHLLDNPTADALARHKESLTLLIQLGKFICLATEHPKFEDRATAEMVAAGMLALKDKLRMWHEPQMIPAESSRILAGCFPDES